MNRLIFFLEFLIIRFNFSDGTKRYSSETSWTFTDGFSARAYDKPMYTYDDLRVCTTTRRIKLPGSTLKKCRL